ncbi:hypothetical protein [Candidatus Thiosymbion oneisti]|uniref:hypothetical protein n=1 Tax=Candidatus Thiosymbion oneisti TaxID=589554 RepID=UPI001061E47A|nr:hypothetical protein [Candidatus Thiosymbion oneisti]
MRLRLFGLEFQIATDGTLELANPPTDLVISFAGRAVESGGQWRAELELRGRLGRCSFNINLPLIRLRRASDAPTLLVPAHDPVEDGSSIRFKLFQDSDPGGNWGLALGGLRLVGDPSRDQPFVTDHDRLVARFPETPLFRSPENALPLALEGSLGGFVLDLTDGRLTATEDAVRVRVGVGVVNDPPQAGGQLFTWHGRSRAGVTVDLRRLADRTVLRFAANDPVASIALNADTVDAAPVSADNPAIAPFEVENSDLEVTFLHRPADNPRLDDLALTPANGDGQVLTAYAFSDARNRASRWRIRERLPLTLRAKTPSRPGGMSISPAVSVRVDSTDPADTSLHGLHGIIGRTRVICAGSVMLKGEEIGEHFPSRDDVNPDVNPDLLSDTVLPRLDFRGPGSNNLGVVTVRPGETFAGQDGHSAANFHMRGRALTLPLIDRKHIAKNRQSNWDLEVGKIEASTLGSQHRRHDETAVHETNLLEPVLKSPATQFFDRLFTAAADDADGPVVALVSADDDERPFPKIGPYDTRFDYRSLGVNIRVEPKIADYMVIRKEDVAGAFELDQIVEFAFDPSGNFMPQREFPQGLAKGSSPANPVVAIVKLSRKISLEKIFDDETIEHRYVIPGGGDRTIDLFDELPSDVKGQGWTGLILFRLPILGESKPNEEPGLAAQLIGNVLGDELELAYLALAPVRDASGTRRMSHFARVLWKNGRSVIDRSDFKDSDGNHNPHDRKETRFQLNRIDVTWADGVLSDLRIDTRFYIDSLFGIRHESTTGGPESRWIDIGGRYDEDQDRVRFLADLSEPWQIFPFTDGDAGFGPLRRLALSSIEITRTGKDRLAISLDGDLELGNFGVPGLGFDGFGLGNDARIDFSGLDLFLPPLDVGLDLNGNFLEFGYPSIRINLDLTPFQIGPIGLKLKSIAMSWDGKGIDWEAPLKLVRAGDFDIELPTFFFDLQIDFGSLPELALKSVDKLLLDLQIGLQGRDGQLWDRIEIGLSAVDFRKFELDLLRFLTISAKTIDLKTKTAKRGTKEYRYSVFQASGVRVLILGREVVKDLSFFLFMSPGGQVGILAFVPTQIDTFLKIRWVLIGRDVLLDPKFAADIMSVDFLDKDKDEDIGGKLATQGKKGGLLPLIASEQPIGDWVFAAGFGLGSDEEPLLNGRFLFQDRKYYGLAVGGGIFKEWFGFEFALSVLYEKGPTPSQDRVVISIRAPKIDLSTFKFLGGVISLRIAFDGSFLLDCGFPWRREGERLWNRTFGAIVTPYQGSGGFYIRKENILAPLGNNLVAAGGGYALQVGLGATFGGGVFSVWVTVGIYSVIEGVVVLKDDNLKAFRLTGAIGVVLRGVGELNFWIISVRVEIVVGAEAGMTLLYRSDDSIPDLTEIGIPATIDPGRPVIRVDFLLYARASARACIGSGWFKLCKSISVSVPMRARYDLSL